jgi:hypothetical protein
MCSWICIYKVPHWSMNHLLAFFCRCLLFAVFVVTSKLESQTVTLDIMQRVVVSCMQICLLAFVWVVYECCVFIIRSITTSRHYEHVTRDESGLDELDELITFDNKKGLQAYIREVHIVGVVLWSTMLCSDYALDQTSFTFLLGMLVGNVMSVAQKVYGGDRVLKGSMPSFVVYWILIGTLVLFYLVRDGQGVVQYTEEQLGITVVKRMDWTALMQVVNVLIAPLSSGMTWTYWVDSRTLLDHYPTSVYSCVLLSIPVMMAMDREFYTNLFVQYDTLATVHLFVSEPLLKFMTMYVLTLSLEVDSVLDVLVVNAAVSGICYVIYGQHNELFDASVGLLLTLLLIFHLSKLTMLTLQQRRARHAACFVIVDEEQKAGPVLDIAGAEPADKTTEDDGPHAL